jgi:LPS-assembly protein
MLQKPVYFELDAVKSQIFKTPLYYQLDSDLIWFYRKDRTQTKLSGQRFDALPRVYLPLKWNNYLNLEPSAGYRGTLWYIGKDSDNDDSMKGTYNRDLYDLKTEISSEVYRVFDTGFEQTDKIKHKVTPTLTWQYIPEKKQDELPYFDAVDLIEKENLVNWSLKNSFTYRKKIKSEAGNTAAKYDYREFCTLEFSQSYDINEENEDTPANWRNGFRKEPFYPIEGDLVFSPVPYMSFEADASWSPYENRFVTNNFLVSLSNSRGDYISSDYRHTREISSNQLKTTIESVNTSCLFNVNEKLELFAAYERNILEKKGIKTEAGFLYKSQCWGFMLKYLSEDDNKKYLLQVDLSGLGDFRTRFSKESVDDWFK